MYRLLQLRHVTSATVFVQVFDFYLHFFILLLSFFSIAVEKPAINTRGNSLKPAVDLVIVYGCCCYPDIHILHPDVHTHIPRSLIESLNQILNSPSCHLATASPPGLQGQFLRVSTTFFEKTLLRSLSTVQGQLFIILKYLVKKVISKKVDGLKTYHAKTLVFHLLHQTPSEQWQACNLMSLTRQALHKLLHFLSDPQAQHNECMKHFFMQDAIVYLKKTGDADAKKKIVEAVSDTMEKLPHLLMRFKETLKPLDPSNTFCFHPFLILPDFCVHDGKMSDRVIVEFDEIYDVVISVVKRLSEENATLQSLTDSIDRIPDCGRTARETLRAMAFIKLDKREDAVRVLRDTMGHSVSRGIECPGDMTADEVTEDMVWQHLKRHDSAWKFFIMSDTQLQLNFLPEKMVDDFPSRILGTKQFFLNFDAARKCLCMEILGDEVTQTMKMTWFEEVVQSGYADVQEMLMVLQYCTDVDLLVRAIHRQRRTVEEEEAVSNRFIKMTNTWVSV
jgi:hypothetical protein